MKKITLNVYENYGSKSLKLWLWMPIWDGSFEHLWLWTPMRGMTLKAYGSKRLWKWWLWMPMEKNDSEGLWKWWLWMPIGIWLWRPVALNACGRNSFEGLYLWTIVGGMALKACGSERLWEEWLWRTVALNAYEGNDFERLKLKEMTLNT